MSNVITFYDIPTKFRDNKSWSPNTLKTKLALIYKGLPYKTEWVEYPDIEKVCKEIGATPLIHPFYPKPTYTLPAIYDPSTKTGISDSALIARYLDKTYPDTPRLIPEGTDTFHAAFDQALEQVVAYKFFPIGLPAACALLAPRSEEHFRRSREAIFGKKLEEFSPEGPIREGHLKEVQDAFSIVAKWFEMDGVTKDFVMGDKVSYADLTLAAWLLSLRRCLGPDSKEWQAIRTWNGGRWERLLERVGKYEAAA